MGDCIETVIAEHEAHLAALKRVAEEYPECTARYYGDITVWVVDMSHEECDSIHTWNSNRAGDQRGKVAGCIIILKNVGQGVNIAPREHYLQLSMFDHYLRGAPTAMEEVIKIFKEHG